MYCIDSKVCHLSVTRRKRVALVLYLNVRRCFSLCIEWNVNNTANAQRRRDNVGSCFLFVRIEFSSLRFEQKKKNRQHKQRRKIYYTITLIYDSTHSKWPFCLGNRRKSVSLNSEITRKCLLRLIEKLVQGGAAPHNFDSATGGLYWADVCCCWCATTGCCTTLLAAKLDWRS